MHITLYTAFRVPCAVGCGSLLLLMAGRCRWRPICRQMAQQSSSSSTERSLASHQDSDNNRQLGEARRLTFKEKVRENTRSTMYGGVIMAGVCVTAALLYTVGRELLANDSSTARYGAALQRCLDDQRVLDALGRPVRAHGETSNRGRRRHVAATPYTDTASGRRRLRLKFYLRGVRQTATVHADMLQDGGSSSDQFRFLFVEVDNLSRQVLVLEDNRAKMDANSIESLSLNS